MKDLVYIYDKKDFTRSELGEIQRDFNMSFVIDGTKDSAKVMVINHSSVEVEPYSIVKHRATNTWWVVSHDKVTRYDNEDYTFLYTHELELLGAIELLNARDLTDCGFNQDKYTITSFFGKLLKLSNFEFNSQYSVSTPTEIGYKFVPLYNIDAYKVVDYVKTFENYTLLSALREFFDAYNCSIKLRFEEDNSGSLLVAVFDVVSKVASSNASLYEESDFNEVQEVKTMDKNSFGTSVVSNAENVISTKTKTYPTTGSVKLSGYNYTITPEDAVLRLPSAIFKVNWIEMYKNKVDIKILHYTDQDYHTETLTSYNPSSIDSMETAIAYARTQIALQSSSFLEQYDEIATVDNLRNYGAVKAYYTDKYDPINDAFYSDYDIPKYRRYSSNVNYEEYDFILSNSEIRNNCKHPKEVVYFERGKDKILGFDILSANSGISGSSKSVTIQRNPFVLASGIDSNNHKIVVFLGNGGTTQAGTLTNLWQDYYFKDASFVVNYIPMSDIKIKVDNSGIASDSQLFNQNGKLTDSVALSKRLLSYSKEIESDTITKYGTFYVKNLNGTITSNIPKVGDLVEINDILYVINNVSLDYFENEVSNRNSEINYYVRAEFTMSKNVAVKSLMVNPSTNIRDYGIPQNNNVKRKQLYRDFYELDYTQDSNETYEYLPLERIFNVNTTYEPYQEHIAIIKLTFEEQYGGTPSDTWYYQLESTTYSMKKMIYEIIDFKDNNIIGYGSQNVWCGWKIERIYTADGIDTINTPISYVDDNGEVNGVYMLMCSQEQVKNAWETYKNSTAYASDDTYDLSNYSVFIPQQVYNNALNDYDFIIQEESYNKDALEVPVFEYVCQIDDTDNVTIGDNILDTNDNDAGYIYLYVVAPKGVYNNNNYTMLNIPNVSLSSLNVAQYTSSDTSVSGVAKLEYNGNNLEISLWGSVTYALGSTPTYSNRVTINDLNLNNNDIVIIRNRFYQDEINNISYVSFTLITDEHTTANIDIKRDNTYLVENYDIARSTTYIKNNLLTTDTWRYLITVDDDYYLDGINDENNGDLRDGNFYLEVKTLQYCTFVFSKPTGVDRVVISINNVPLYTLSTDGGTLPLTQGLNYSYTVYAESGYNITSGGSGSGTTSGGTINITPVAQPLERTLTFSMSKRITCVVAISVDGVQSYEPVYNGRIIYHIPNNAEITLYFNNTTNTTNYNIEREIHDFDMSTNTWVTRAFTDAIRTNNCYKFSNTTQTFIIDSDKTITLSDIGVRPRTYTFAYMFAEAHNVPTGSFFVFKGSGDVDIYSAPNTSSLQYTNSYASTTNNGDIGFTFGSPVSNAYGILEIAVRAGFPANSTQGLSGYVKQVDTYTDFDSSDLAQSPITNCISLGNLVPSNLLTLTYVIPDD